MAIGKEEGVLLSESAFLGGTECRLTLTTSHLRATFTGTGAEVKLELSDIIGVTSPISYYFWWWFWPGFYKNGLEVHHVDRLAGNYLNINKVNIEFPSEDIRARWKERIQELLKQTELRRPRRLLVFINPIGGNGKATRVFNDQVAPLFDIAGIDTTVIVTRRGGESTEVIMAYDLNTIDGVVAVGGDGTVYQCAKGLLLTAARDAGIDINKSDSRLVKSAVRLGHIPAGSGNDTAARLAGVKKADPLTSALRIIMGGSVLGNVSSVHQNEKFLGMVNLLSSYGFLSDMFTRAEEDFRWLGKLRYMWSYMLVSKVRRTSEVEVEILSHGKNDSGCTKLQKELVDILTIQNGPKNNPQSGVFELLLVQPCTTKEHSNVMKKALVEKESESLVDLPYIDIIKTNEFSIRPLCTEDNNNALDFKGRDLRLRAMLDGEMVYLEYPPCIQMRHHQGIITYFGVQPHSE